MARILFHLKDAYATISPYFQPPDDYWTSWWLPPPPPLRQNRPGLILHVRLRHHFQSWRLVTSHNAIVVQYPPLPNSTGARSLYTRACIFFPTFELFPPFLLHGSAKGLNYGSNQPHHIRLKKNFFQKIFCALFGVPGTLALYFQIPLLPLHIHIFPTFRPFSLFLLQGSLSIYIHV